MILREKNHQDVKEKITKKFKVPRDIREDFLIYESEDAKEKLYTLISHVPMSKFKGVQTETVEE